MYANKKGEFELPESWNSKRYVHVSSTSKVKRVQRHLGRRFSDGLKQRNQNGYCRVQYRK